MCLSPFESHFRMYADLDKCEAFIIAIPFGIDQKRARTLIYRKRYCSQICVRRYSKLSAKTVYIGFAK